MKYKVTPRGWVVFSVLGILVIYSIFSLLQFLLKDDINKLATENGNEPSITKNNDSISSEDNLSNSESNENNPADSSDESESPDDSQSSKDDSLNPDEDAVIPDDEASSSDEESETPDGESNMDNDVAALLEENDTLYFDPNVAIIKDVHKETLNKWASWLSDNLTLEVVIEGHINGYPDYKDTSYGLSISEQRALVLKDYLVALGIDSERITLKNLGSQEQAVLTDDYSQQYLNRRAVIYFKK